MPKQKCQQVPKQVAVSNPVRQCSKVPKERCHQVSSINIRILDIFKHDEDSLQVPIQVSVQKCFHIPQQECSNVPVQAPVAVNVQQCYQVPPQC